MKSPIPPLKNYLYTNGFIHADSTVKFNINTKTNDRMILIKTPQNNYSRFHVTEDQHPDLYTKLTPLTRFMNTLSFHSSTQKYELEFRNDHFRLNILQYPQNKHKIIKSLQYTLKNTFDILPPTNFRISKIAHNPTKIEINIRTRNKLKKWIQTNSHSTIYQTTRYFLSSYVKSSLLAEQTNNTLGRFYLKYDNEEDILNVHLSLTFEYTDCINYTVPNQYFEQLSESHE